MTTTENATYISHRPAWAGNVTISEEAIDYTWTAPTVPESIEPDGDRYPAPVMLTRDDMLYVNDTGVVVDPGEERIFLLDGTFDVVNARKLATAIRECCDRIVGTASTEARMVSTGSSSCPSWCVEDQQWDDGPSSRAVVHHAMSRTVSLREDAGIDSPWTYAVHLKRWDWEDGQVVTELQLDEACFSAAKARELGQALIAAADDLEAGNRIEGVGTTDTLTVREGGQQAPALGDVR